MNEENNILPTLPSGEELEREQEDVQYAEIRKLTEQCELDPAKDYGKPKYLFKMNGIGLSPLGDIQMVKAPQKNGKTFLFSLMMGAVLNGEYLGLTCEIENPTILYIDTEQHPRNTQLVYRRACYIGGMPGREKSQKFHAFYFRGKTYEQIQGAVFYLIEKIRPTVVFIDGFRDMVKTINNEEENVTVIAKLMDYAMRFDCSIWSIIHVNPGSDKARGWSGSEYQNKASDVLTCLKEKRPEGVVFTINQSDARNRDIQEFSFVIEDKPDGEGDYIAIPVATHISVKEKTAADELMSQALSERPLRWGDLRDKIMEIGDIKKSTAANRIKDAIDSGIIYLDPVMNKYHYKGLDLDNEEDKPF